MIDDSSVSRRQVLGVFTLGTAVALAGCSGGSGGSNGSGSDGATAGSTSTETSTATEQPDTETSTASNQDSMDEENEIPDWEDADDLYETQKLIYKDVEDTAGACAFTVDPDYIDGSELEPSKYDGQSTLEHALIHALTDDGEYKGNPEEILISMQDPEDVSGSADTSLHLYGNGGRITNESGFDPSRESQVDGFEHIDGDGVLHSSDLPEYVEEVLME